MPGLLPLLPLNQLLVLLLVQELKPGPELAAARILLPEAQVAPEQVEVGMLLELAVLVEPAVVAAQQTVLLVAAQALAEEVVAVKPPCQPLVVDVTAQPAR
jgi:hypothetical protein